MAPLDHAGPVPQTRGESRASLLYDPRFRSILVQLLVALGTIAAIAWFTNNTIQNLRRSHVASGFDFLWARAGFDISQTLVSYTREATYARAFLVGFLNTVEVAVIGIVLATVLGIVVGFCRLSTNWLVGRIATVYVETLRNIPVLLQLLFWYKAVLSVLPGPRQGYQFPFGMNLSNRGLLIPRPIFEPGFGLTVIAVLVALIAIILTSDWARRRQLATGQPFPIVRVTLAILIGLPAVVFLASGMPLSFEYPELAGFNFNGGLAIKPEFLALELGLSLYTATYIAEVVRAGILAVSHGQTEAAYSLGFKPGLTRRLIILPQALRVIIPPLTNQYLNLTKNSSLAVAVGYPDLVSVFSGTVLNQTGQAIETIFITMMVYLVLSLLTSAFMNWFNARVALVER